jgi:outer membrane protein OmpA-like peptidoglycan-associated protein
LLINTNTRSIGFGGINGARVRGISSFSTNIAGLAYSQKTNVGVNYTSYLTGTGTSIYNLSFAQELSKGNVIGVCVNSMDFGKIMKTTTIAPEGVGTFNASLMNIGLSYGRLFTEHISGGVQVKVIAESLDNISASGVAFDAGLQYSTGKRDNIHFGVNVRNVGTNMTYSGDGLIYNVNEPNNRGYKMSQTMQGAKFGLPSLLSISGAYDLYLGAAEANCNPNNRFTIAANYNYNSFTNDQFGLGLEYSLKEMFTLRAGYMYENNITNSESKQAHNGLTAGFSYDMPLDKTKKNGPALSIDYAFAMTKSFNNNHSIGITYTMGNPNNTCSRNAKIKAVEPKVEAKVEAPKPVVEAVIEKAKEEVKVIETIPTPEVPVVTPPVVVPVVEAETEEHKAREHLVELTPADKDSIIVYATKIKFKSGKDELNATGVEHLNKLYSIVRGYKKATFKIDAHTDNVGNSADNMELSRLRAEMVKNYLVKKGIHTDKITVQNFGDTKPKDSNDTPEGQANNRRVEVTVDFHQK